MTPGHSSNRRREVNDLLASTQRASPPMPVDATSDEEWDAWTEVMWIEAIIAGWASRPGDLRDDADVAGWNDAKAALADPHVRALLGGSADDVERLLTLLYQGLRGRFPS